MSKPPPSWWWMTGPGVLIAGSVALFAALLAWTVSDLADYDARVPVDGAPHQVRVATDGDRMLLVDSARPAQRCVVTDVSGQAIEQRDLAGEVTLTAQGRQWSGLSRFDPGDGRVVVTCRVAGLPDTLPAPGPASEVLITEALDVGGFVARIMGAILAPMILGGIGLLWGVLLGALMITRRSAGETRPPPPPPPPLPPPSPSS